MVVQGLTTVPIFCSFFSVNNINAIERLEFIQKEHSNVRIIDTNSPEFVVCHTEKSIYIHLYENNFVKIAKKQKILCIKNRKSP